MSQPSKGYVIVASRTQRFYDLACNLAESIIDYYPEARIALFTEEKFMTDRAHQSCEFVLPCSDHYRAKLEGMAQSPYDITFYIDADTEVMHEDIATVFDNLGDNDMVYTPLVKENDYAFQSRYFTPDNPSEEYAFHLCGGVCLYDMRNPLIRDFMNDWDTYYKKQRTGEWWPTKEDGNWDLEHYPRDEIKMWDQFTLWWLTEKEDKYKDLKIGVFDDWPRWNWYGTYNTYNTPREKDIVVYHISAGITKWGTKKNDDLISL